MCRVLMSVFTAFVAAQSALYAGTSVIRGFRCGGSQGQASDAHRHSVCRGADSWTVDTPSFTIEYAFIAGTNQPLRVNLTGKGDRASLNHVYDWQTFVANNVEDFSELPPQCGSATDTFFNQTRGFVPSGVRTQLQRGTHADPCRRALMLGPHARRSSHSRLTCSCRTSPTTSV
jgi:hypothetical protein